MGVQVVTIAMTTGARAEQVGRLVAECLGCSGPRKPRPAGCS